MLESLYNNNDASLLKALAAPDLRHYSAGIDDGVEAWAAYAARFAGTEPLIEVHRTVGEGNRIGVHAHYRWNPERVIDDGPGVAVAHIFTVEDGRIVEAVELTQAVAAETVSGNDMFSQLRPSAGGQQQGRNRATAERVVTEFLAGDTGLRDELLSDYTQHNPFIPDGAEGITGVIEALGGNPNDYQWAMAEGDLAWTYTRYRSEAMGTGPLVAVDIWRFDESGKVTEHWDILEPDFTSPAGHTFPR
jgi:predicted SnoaL-like aldol condensation-catalyzing enzyme